MEEIRVITLKKDIPHGTTSHNGFHLLNMGKEGNWLVDEEHPGYPGCVRKAFRLALQRGENRYSTLLKQVEKKETANTTPKKLSKSKPKVTTSKKKTK